MDQNYILQRIERTKALIEAYENAIEAVVFNGVQHYSLDTGQNKTVVTKLDQKWLNDQVEKLYSRLGSLNSRIYGSSIVMRPAF